MMVGVLGILYFLGIKDQPGAFWGFFAMFLVLFFATGVGNASTFQMIPNIMRKEMDRLMPTADVTARLHQAEKESAAITGFTSAIAAFGAFFIPKSYGTSIDLTGGVQAALLGVLPLLCHLRRDHLPCVSSAPPRQTVHALSYSSRRPHHKPVRCSRVTASPHGGHSRVGLGCHGCSPTSMG